VERLGEDDDPNITWPFLVDDLDLAVKAYAKDKGPAPVLKAAKALHRHEGEAAWSFSWSPPPTPSSGATGKFLAQARNFAAGRTSREEFERRVNAYAEPLRRKKGA
jgi:hypothetical protein